MMRPIGFTYWADIYCADCGNQLPEVDPEGNEKYPVFFRDEVRYEAEEGETEATCADCGTSARDW